MYQMKLEAFTSRVVGTSFPMFSPKLSLQIPHLVSSSANFSWNPRPRGSWLPSSKVPWCHGPTGPTGPTTHRSAPPNHFLPTPGAPTAAGLEPPPVSARLCVCVFCRENMWMIEINGYKWKMFLVPLSCPMGYWMILVAIFGPSPSHAPLAQSTLSSPMPKR